MTSKKKKPISNEDLLEAIGKGFQSMEDRMATKEDLKQFATKDDLKAFATKEDLKDFATKKDVARIEAKLDDIADFQETETLDLQKRVKKLETHVFKTA